MIADALGGGGESTVFTGDNDPQLVGDALPFALKLYESLLEMSPEHRGLQLTTGSGFIMYANAFIQGPAGMLTVEEYEKQAEMFVRAKKLYIRGRDILLNSLDKKYSGFRKALEEGNAEKIKTILASMKKEDVPFLYWAGAGWVGAFSTDPFDVNLSLGIPKASAMMQRALELDEAFNNGAIHDFYVSFHASLPPSLGGDISKVDYHFKKALELSKGLSASPYVSLATTRSIAKQDVDEFKDLLSKALAIDVDKDPKSRLANIISQRKAKWYLDRIDDFFLPKDDGTGEIEDEE